MKTQLISLAVLFGCAIAAPSAFAHAFLDHATPAVGATVGGSPSELVLTFTQAVVPSFSTVTVSGPGGAIAASKPTVEAGHADTLRVRLGRALPPGTYNVKWHVVSVDTHPTSGKYRFTIAP